MANPNSVDVFTQFITDLQTNSQSVPGMLADQILTGSVEFQATENFYQDVADNGYYFIIEQPSGESDFFTFNSSFDITAFLFYPIPADQSYDWKPVNKQIGSLISGWARWTNPSQSIWVKGQNRSAVKMKWYKPEIRYSPKPCSKFLKCEQAFIVSTKFEFTMPFIADQACNPFLNPEA